MKPDNSKNQNPRVLFVCYGNTCRSPMAEGLAKKMLGDKARMESAGLMPMFESAAPDAVAILRELYDVDISHHRPKDITGLSLGDYDRIIVLDSNVYNQINKHAKDLSNKLILWDTEDPYGQDKEVYKRVARWLEVHLREHLVSLLFDLNSSQQ
jgi:protein-tyrosine-phosphatase